MNIFLLSFDSDIKLIFMWWLEQFGKLINVMKKIPIFGKSVTLFHILIALAVIKIMITFVKFYNHSIYNNNNDQWLHANKDVLFPDPVEHEFAGGSYESFYYDENGKPHIYSRKGW